MRRVSVVGNAGSGKSTLGRELAARLGVPFVELDAMFHQAGWTPLDAEEFQRRVAEVVAGDGWVVDGNYRRGGVLSLVWDRADTVVWFDLPRRTVMRRIVLRTLRRLARRDVLWNGNRERWRNLVSLDPYSSVIAWAWYRHGEYRRRYGEAVGDLAHAHLEFVRIGSAADGRALLARAEAAAR